MAPEPQQVDRICALVRGSMFVRNFRAVNFRCTVQVGGPMDPQPAESDCICAFFQEESTCWFSSNSPHTFQEFHVGKIQLAVC